MTAHSHSIYVGIYNINHNALLLSTGIKTKSVRYNDGGSSSLLGRKIARG